MIHYLADTHIEVKNWFLFYMWIVKNHLQKGLFLIFYNSRNILSETNYLLCVFKVILLDYSQSNLRNFWLFYCLTFLKNILSDFSLNLWLKHVHKTTVKIFFISQTPTYPSQTSDSFFMYQKKLISHNHNMKWSPTKQHMRERS